jgi:hypothetical protein
MNGLNKGRILQSDHSCSDIAKHISESKKLRLLQSIIELDLKVVVMIEESTNLSKKIYCCLHYNCVP